MASAMGSKYWMTNNSFTYRARKRSWGGSYYDQKKTSSKCVGGLMVYIDVPVLDKKLSPIIQKKSDSTSPESISPDNKNINSGSYTVEKTKSKDDAADIMVNKENIKQQNTIVIVKPKEPSKTVITETRKQSLDTSTDNKKSNYATTNDNEKNISSDSLLQHIYNLENPSFYKQSKTSIDLMENKLEREYRKIFSMKSKLKKSSNEKPIPDFKSASILRKRFEALRQGLGRKKDSKKDSIVIKISSQASVLSRKDVSIVSDPPSLEARSFSKTKVDVFSPKPSQEQPSKTRDSPNSYCKEKESPNWSTNAVESEYQGVKGMFRLWGKKFNLDENSENIAHDDSTTAKNDIKIEPVLPKEEFGRSNKKEGKMFSFFKKKTKVKDKSKHPYKSKKGVTAGRCEVGDGLMIKIGVAKEYSNPITPTAEVTDEYNDILRETWLKTFVAKKIESRKSAHIRWNNKMFTTSSSTVFELMDCVYKNLHAFPRSRSEINIGDSSSYYSYTKQKANFMKQNIKAWMIPKTILDKQIINTNQTNKSQEQNKNIEITFSNRKWFIDKSEAFSRNIEIVLHSNNIERQNHQSSDYITINIPEGYFSDNANANSTNNNTSDEEVFKVIEYETQNSCTGLTNTKNVQSMETGDHTPLSNDIEITVSVKDSKNNESKVLEKIIKQPPLHRDVVIQGSNVYVPKRCDVIGVGIITQKDIRDIKKPILKIPDYLTDEESEPMLLPQKKCEFAESYLQDYYRNWTPLGMDLSTCVSDSQLRDSSENNSLNSLNQGDGSKSCPNIYDDFQASTIVSSCETSSCSQCRTVCVDEKKQEDTRVNKFLCKFKKKISDSVEQSPNDVKRLLPKDSLEVFKRRKLYAASNKSNWGVDYDRLEPFSVPSVDDKCAQNTSDVGPKTIRPCCKRPEARKKTCPKRVLLPDCETMNELLSEQISNKAVEGILTFKGAGGCDVCKTKDTKCSKHTKVIPEAICEIPQPGCKESCIRRKSPPCSKKNSPTCNVPAPPSCPVGPPSPCQKPCPPTPPPCQMKLPCMKETQQSSCKKPPPCRNLYSSPPCSKRNSPPPCPKSPPSIHKLKSSPSSTPPCEDKTLPHLCCPKPSPPRLHSPNASPKMSPCRSPPRPKSKQCHIPDCPSKTSIGQSLKSKPCDLPDCPSKSSIQQLQKKPCDSPLKSDIQQRKNKLCNIPDCPSKSNVRQPPRPKQCEISSCTSNSSIQACPPPPKCRKSVSQETGISLTMAPSPKCSVTKHTNMVKRLMDKVSSFALGKTKECRPDCANRTRMNRQRTPSPLPTPSPTRQEICSDEGRRNRPKQTGLHLKKMPSQKKSCSDECVRVDSDVIRLNSKEEIFIRLKQGSPSTEEIREGYNIKVKDEDGRTLIERRDYRRSDGKNRTFLVRDMYRDSHVNRVSTPNLGNNDVSDKKSLESKQTQNFTSLSNIIEINLTLKFKQNEKTTEININNTDDLITDNEETSLRESPKEVYLVQDKGKTVCKDSDKKDLNIKVTIKNYRQNEVTNKRTQECCENSESQKKMLDKFNAVSTHNLMDQPKDNKDNETFCNKISEKFNTISTGYSEILLEQQAYSIHKTTIDLTNSTDNNQTMLVSDRGLAEIKSKDDISLCMCSAKLSKQSVNVSDNHSKISVKDNLLKGEILSTNQNRDADLKTASYVKETAKYVSNVNTAISDASAASDNEHKLNNNPTKKYPISILKPSCNTEKKEMLKEIFEVAGNLRKQKKKEKMKLIRQMIHAILTSDSSDLEDPTVSNKLADEVTYASLKPNYFRDTDSMNNFCQFDSSASDKKSIKSESEEQLYPTKDNTETSECSSSSADEDTGCLCSHVATRLNTNQIEGTGCCCGRMKRKDVEMNCNVREEHIKVINRKTEYVNVETQDSKFTSGKIKSVVMTNMSTTVRIQPDSTDSKKHEKISKEVMKKIRLPSSKRGEGCQMTTLVKKLRDFSNHNIPILGSNSEDSLRQNNGRRAIRNNETPEDILQLNETKKAVLEIYAERTVSDKGQHIVARLPKFVSNRGGELQDYKEMITGFKHISKRNITMLSINR